MRIAYDAAPLMRPKTGVGHYTSSLLEALLAYDDDLAFDLFALTRSANTLEVPTGDRIRLRHLRIPARVAVTAWEIMRFPRGERLVGNADVVHGTNFWIPPLKRRNGVVTIHDLTFLLYPEMVTPQVRRYRWIVPKVLERCSLVITPAETIRQQVASELGFPADHIVVTPEGVRGRFMSAQRDRELERSLGIAGEYVLFAGTIEPRKNVERMVRAFASMDHNDLTLVIAGPPGWGGLDLPGLVRDLGIEERVVIKGYIPDGQLGALMAGALAFLFPSIYEGFGLPPLEAMAAGVPVVAGRAGPLPEVLGDAPIWCDPLEVDSIAAAIEVAVSDSEVREMAIDQGRQRASQYTWETTAAATLDAYRLVAGA